MIAYEVLSCKADPYSIQKRLRESLNLEAEFLQEGSTKVIQYSKDGKQLLEFRCTGKIIEVYVSTTLGEGEVEFIFGDGIRETIRCIGNGYISVGRSHVTPLLVVIAKGDRGWFEGRVTPRGRKASGTCPFKIMTELAIAAGIKVNI